LTGSASSILPCTVQAVVKIRTRKEIDAELLQESNRLMNGTRDSTFQEHTFKITERKFEWM